MEVLEDLLKRFKEVEPHLENTRKAIEEARNLGAVMNVRDLMLSLEALVTVHQITIKYILEKEKKIPNENHE